MSNREYYCWECEEKQRNSCCAKKIELVPNDIVKAFKEGIKVGVADLAIWKNGKQFVGITFVPLEKAIKELQDKVIL